MRRQEYSTKKNGNATSCLASDFNPRRRILLACPKSKTPKYAHTYTHCILLCVYVHVKNATYIEGERDCLYVLPYIYSLLPVTSMTNVTRVLCVPPLSLSLSLLGLDLDANNDTFLILFALLYIYISLSYIYVIFSVAKKYCQLVKILFVKMHSRVLGFNIY